jgi:hypothetical protein
MSLLSNPLIAVISIVFLVIVSSSFFVVGRRNTWSILAGVLVLLIAAYLGYNAFFVPRL